jgi:hypothetical protein
MVTKASDGRRRWPHPIGGTMCGKRITVWIGLVIALALAGCSSGAGGDASAATYFHQQTCNGWSELQDGIANSTMTQSDVSNKLNTMKSNADSAASEDPKWQDLDTAVQQLRAAVSNNDSSSIPDYMVTISAACP